jgi:hypothetical protein
MANTYENAIIDCIFDEFADELERADAKYGPMPGMKDGLHTLMIEVAELRREVETENFNQKALRKEAVQVGAMATKFIRDIVNKIDTQDLGHGVVDSAT